MDSSDQHRPTYDQRKQRVNSQINIAGDATIIMPPETEPAEFINVPPLRRGVVGRTMLLDDLIDRLTTKQMHLLATYGLPGVGKTTLALALVHDQRILDHFSDGVLWAPLGPEPDIAGIQTQWADAVGADIAECGELLERTEKINNAIGTRRFLIVLDDVWREEVVDLLFCGGPNAAHVVTTQNMSLACSLVDEDEIQVPVLDSTSSYQLLNMLACDAWKSDPEKAAKLADQVGGLPLALSLLGGELAKPERSLLPSLSDAAFDELSAPENRLKLAAKRLGSTSRKKYTLKRSVLRSIDALGEIVPGAAAAFSALGAFAPKPASFDIDAARTVTQADDITLALLISRSLVEKTDEGEYSLHKTLADVAASKTSSAARRCHCNYYADLITNSQTPWTSINHLIPQILQAHKYDCTTIIGALRSATLSDERPEGERRNLAFLLVRLGWYGCGAPADELLHYLELTVRYFPLERHQELFRECIAEAIGVLDQDPVAQVRLLIFRAATLARSGKFVGAGADYDEAEALLRKHVATDCNNQALSRLAARVYLGKANILAVHAEKDNKAHNLFSHAAENYALAFAAASEYGADPILSINILTELAFALTHMGQWDDALARITMAKKLAGLIEDKFERTVHQAYTLEAESRIHLQRGTATDPYDIDDLETSLELCYEGLDLIGDDPRYGVYAPPPHINAGETLRALEKAGAPSRSDQRLSAADHLLIALELAEALEHSEFIEDARIQLKALGVDPPTNTAYSP